MHYATKIDDSAAVTPSNFQGHSFGYRRQILINRNTGSPHMTLSVGHLDAEGFVEPALHSYEFSMYVLSGSLAVTTLGHTTLLDADHAIAVPVGTTYSLRALNGPVKWLHMRSEEHT